jgi:Glycosyltransferase
MKNKRVCIDVNSIVPYFVRGYMNGVGRTSMELLEALAEKKELPFEIVLYSQNLKGVGGRNLNLPFESKHFYFPYRENWNKIMSLFPVREVLTNSELIHIPHNFEYVYNPSKVLITLHDALFMKLDESMFNHAKMRQLVPPLINKCRGIVTCSEASKRDITEYMKVEEEKISVIPWGISRKVFFREEKDIVESFNRTHLLERPYFTMVSCNEGRKNTISLLRAFRLYLNAGGNFDLVLLWGNPPSSILNEFSSEMKSKRVRFLSPVDESGLRALYTGAKASFFPSKYEGFGLPVLESLACGTPVVTCRNSSLEEVGGNVAFYTEPEDLERMAQYMIDFEKNAYNYSEIRETAETHLLKFSWEKTAASYIDFYSRYF